MDTKKKLEKERDGLLYTIERYFETPMILLGFVWLILLVVELIWGISTLFQNIIIVIWILFIIDFLIKFIIASHKLKYLKKNWLVAISLVVPALRVLRAFRIIRLMRGLRGVRLVRVVTTLNRSMKSLGATMRRRGFIYVVILSLIVIFAGAAGMYTFEFGGPGFESYGDTLWWTAMRIITAGTEHFPDTGEGRVLGFIIALYGYAIFGYVTATLASFFIGRDAEEKDTPVAGVKDVKEVQKEIAKLRQTILEMNNNKT